MAGSSQDDVSVVDSVTTAVLFITRFSSVLQLDLGGGDSFRRTWDSRKYEKLARDRADTDREGSTLTMQTIHAHYVPFIQRIRRRLSNERC